jgi:DNA-binding response OmpR family regulator
MGFITEYDSEWPWRILLIEDNPADEKMVRKCLAKHGIKCDLIVIEDGQRAVDFFEATEDNQRLKCPDLVLLDIGLPYHDGLEILKKIRAGDRCGRTPVIVMTGSESAEGQTVALKHAAKHYFEKTANYDEFLELGNVIKQVLGGDAPPREK